jgi:hypothetical protein
MSTLLGPEGPELPPGFGLGVGPFLWTFFPSHHSRTGKGYRPYFENYTVDASILNLSSGILGFWGQITKIKVACRPFGVGVLLIIGQFLFRIFSGTLIDSNSCDFKFLRANGECLGM